MIIHAFRNDYKKVARIDLLPHPFSHIRWRSMRLTPPYLTVARLRTFTGEQFPTGDGVGNRA